LETGESAAWPVTYADFEPYYSQAEKVYAVHGSTSGDPTEPPRSAPYPYPPIPHQGVIASLVERLQADGMAVSHIPRGIDRREGGRCVLCATCDGYYCRLDAKMDAEIACIRPALATGNVTLLTNTECLRVLVSPGSNKATGVQLRRGTVESTVYAGSVAVCAGIMETAPLLRRSRTNSHPDGIGNNQGCLGRYMCGHTVTTLLLVMGSTPLPPTHTKTFAINSFYRPTEDWPYPQGVIQMAGQLPTFDRPSLVRALVSRSLVCFCMTEEPSSREAGLAFVGDEVSPHITRAAVCEKTAKRLSKEASRIFRRAGCKAVLAVPKRNVGWHSVGAARMGSDPRSSVLDSHCRVHGFDNLYVVDSSSLPSPGAVNTGLTLMALAIRAADDIASQGVAAVTRTQAPRHRSLEVFNHQLSRD
jgi:choline dehydrogenase-like flavoprotein